MKSFIRKAWRSIILKVQFKRVTGIWWIMQDMQFAMFGILGAEQPKHMNMPFKNNAASSISNQKRCDKFVTALLTLHEGFLFHTRYSPTKQCLSTWVGFSCASAHIILHTAASVVMSRPLRM